MKVLFGEEPEQKYPSFSQKKHSYISIVMWIDFINGYFNKTDKTKYLDDDDSGVKLKK